MSHIHISCTFIFAPLWDEIEFHSQVELAVVFLKRAVPYIRCGNSEIILYHLVGMIVILLHVEHRRLMSPK